MNSPVPRSSIEAGKQRILPYYRAHWTKKTVGKLGLLPKRPVSLLRDPAATSSNSPPAASFHPQPTRQPSEDDDDILEYTENPFEEKR